MAVAVFEEIKFAADIGIVVADELLRFVVGELGAGLAAENAVDQAHQRVLAGGATW